MALVDSRSSPSPAVGARSRPSLGHSSGIWVTQGGMTAQMRAASPCRQGCGRFAGCGMKVVTKEGVHNVHTLGFGSGRTGAGLGRIAEVFGEVAEIQGLEPGSSPTSGTVFPQVRGILCVSSCGQSPHSSL